VKEKSVIGFLGGCSQHFTVLWLRCFLLVAFKVNNVEVAN